MQLPESSKNDVVLLSKIDQLIAFVKEGMQTMEPGLLSRMRVSTKQFILQRYESNSHFYTDYAQIDSWPSLHNLKEIMGLLLAIKDDIYDELGIPVSATSPFPIQERKGSEDDKLTAIILAQFYIHTFYNWEAIKNMIELNSDYYEYTTESAKIIFQKFIDRKIIAYSGHGPAYNITEEGKKLYERKYVPQKENSKAPEPTSNEAPPINTANFLSSKVSNIIEMIEVFLSYSWDSPAHQEQVAAFANYLRISGYDARIDIMLSEQETSIDFTKMMHTAIHQSKKVIIILTKGYKERAEKYAGGVGQEYILLLKDIDKSPNKYILVSFEGINDDIVPFGLRSREIIDCSLDSWEQKLFSKLSDETRYVFSPVAPTKPAIQKIVPGKFIKDVQQKTKLVKIDNEAKVKASLKMEKRIKKDLIDHKMMKERKDRVGMFPGTNTIFTSSRAIIRSIDDKHYPEVDDKPTGPISSWVREQLYDLTNEGIEIWIAAALGIEIIMDKFGNWEILREKNDSRKSDPQYKSAEIMIICTIPYHNIIDYRKDGDEYFSDPHIFCKFDFNGTPYSKTRYKIYYGEETELPTYDLDPSKKTTFDK